MNSLKLLEYTFFAERLCLGERVKGGVYRPSSTVLASTRIRGAIYERYGLSLHGLGILQDKYRTNHITISPQARVTRQPRVPIKIMFLEEAAGKVYLLDKGDLSSQLDSSLTLYIGGMRHRGFGECLLTGKKVLEVSQTDYRVGMFRTRVPKSIAAELGIEVIKPKYGYLFERLNEETGQYVLSYFEGSTVQAPRWFVKERR